MPVEGREKGLRSLLEVRFGITTPTYLGVNTQKPALALLDGEGVEGINLRIKGGRPISRGGQEKVNAESIAEIHGFTDTTSDAGLNGSTNKDLSGDGTPYNIFYVIGNNAIGLEGSFVHVDTESNVVITTNLPDNGRPTSVPIDYNGGHYASIDRGETDASVVAVPSLDELFSLPRTGVSCTSNGVMALGTDLLVSWVDGASGAKISLWDGTHLTLDATGTGLLAKFQGTAYAGTTNLLYRRIGNGSWTSLAYPGATSFAAIHAMEYKGRLYIIGADTGLFVIYSTDGNTLVKERTLVPAVLEFSVAQFAIVRGSLYYWYHDGTDGATYSRIGKFDGASWEDEHADVTGDVAGFVYTRGMGFVGGHDGANLVLADDSGNLYVWESDGINIFGPWTNVLNIAAGVYGVGSPTPGARVGTVRF